MALKPTIFKIKVSLTDLNREIYESLNLTLAQHPSETTERMMARFLAYCLHYHERLEFCKGLSDTEEPDLWLKSLTGEIELWIDVGEPAADRVKKAARQAIETVVYSFNSKADTWWQIENPKLEAISARIGQLPWPAMQALAETVERTMDVSVTISADSLFVATAKGEVELSVKTLQDPS